MSKKKFIVSLSDNERYQLQSYVNTGTHPARSIKRARMLLLADMGISDPRVAEQVGACKATVFNIRRRYCREGLDAVLVEKPRSGAPRRFSGRDEAHLTTLACSKPPAGHQRWTVRLLADRFVFLGLVDEISKSTVQEWLKKTS